MKNRMSINTFYPYVDWALLSLSDPKYDFNMVKENRQSPLFLLSTEVIVLSFRGYDQTTMTTVQSKNYK
jgi:hypothetical protein